MVYTQRKFNIRTAKIFFGYVAKYETLYQQLRVFGYEIIFKETMVLPNGDIK
ncbi:hypothetical protein FACS189428_6120 [Clostridia bacterium]|nr:hypothetical protein FACS189428_6120 [Clostridia bacterium]